MKLRRFLSSMMALLLVCSLPASALAAEYDLAQGSVIINATESGQTVTHGSNNAVPDSAPVITQSGDDSTANTITITAQKDTTANVILNGVNIQADEAAIQTSGEGHVVIDPNGANTVQSGEGHAGVEKANSGTLSITDVYYPEGSLTATGGNGGAGIGGGNGNNGDNIYIYSSEVTATGGAGGAGIGGGAGGNGEEIHISDGTVDATGGDGGAGIGGGAGGDGSKIYISGGDVTSKGGENAAGIGGGADGNGSFLGVSGGTVDAIGGDPKNVGNPDGNNAEEGVGGGAGIGGGANGTGTPIAVKNDAVVTATGKGNAADIGNGNSLDATQKQENDVIVDYLTPNGSINGKPGSFAPPTAADYTIDTKQYENATQILELKKNGSSDGFINYLISVNAAIGTEYVRVSIKGTGSDPTPSATLMQDRLIVTSASDYISLSGNRGAAASLLRQGVKQTVIRTSDGQCTVNNSLLKQVTGDDGSFQVTSDCGDVSISSTDGNNSQVFGMAMSYLSETQEGPKNTRFLTAQDDALGKILLASTDYNARLKFILSGSGLQIMQDMEFSCTAISVGDTIVGYNNRDVIQTIGSQQLGSASIIISAEKDASPEQRFGCAIVDNDYAMNISQQASQSILQQSGQSIPQQASGSLLFQINKGQLMFVD